MADKESFAFRITAEDETRAGFQSALNNARKIGKQVGDAASQGQSAGLAGSLKGLGQAFEPVEKLGKIFTSLQAGAVAFQGITGALRKDWDAVGEAIQQLPFGIGQVSKFAMDFKAEITGARKELEALGEEAKRIDRETATAQQRNREFRSALERFTTQARDREREAQLGTAKTDADKIRMQMGFDLEDLNEDLDRALKNLEKLGSGPQSRAADMLREQAEKARQAIKQIADQDLAKAMEKTNTALKDQKQIVSDVRVQWERWANVARTNFVQAMDAVKRAQDRGAGAREDLRRAVGDIAAAQRERDQRAFEIALARSKPEEQLRLKFDRAKQMIDQAGKAGFQTEESQQRINQALDLFQELLSGELPEAPMVRDTRRRRRRRGRVDEPVDPFNRANIEAMLKAAEEAQIQGLRQRRDEANEGLRQAAREQFQAIGDGAKPMLQMFEKVGRAADLAAGKLLRLGDGRGGNPPNDMGGVAVRAAAQVALALLGG